MKKCPYCAEQIQDDAIICRYCGRGEPVAPPPQGTVGVRWGNVIGLGVLGLFILFAIIATAMSSRGPTARAQKPTAILDVSGARNALGIVLTNREVEALTNCVVTILERGRSDEWNAVVEKLDPMQTEVIRWDRFIRSGTRMPGYIGTSSRGATIDCESHIKTRQGAGLHFQ